MRKLTFLLALALAAAPAIARASKPKIAVLGLKAAKGIDEATVHLLDELLLTEIQEAGDFEVFGSADIASMMTLEEQKIQLTGCADDSCLAEIGGALGVNLLVASSVGAVGERWLLNVKLLDVSTARVLKRSSEDVAGEQSRLLDAIKDAAAKVVRAIRDRGQGDLTTSVESPESKPTTVMRVAPWLALGVAVAAGGAGGALMGLGAADEKDLESEVFGNDRWKDLKDSGETRYTAGGVLLGVAGAAAVGTLVLFLVGGGDDASAAVVPMRGGVVAAAGFGF